MPFKIFIDESGDAGISKVRTSSQQGASPYFVMGAAVMQPATELHARKLLDEIRVTISKQSWSHATELDHFSKVYFARKAASLKARYFAVISNKATLEDYAGQIGHDPHKFYNKCTKYLLECVCRYLLNFRVKEDDVSVVLEKRNHDYDAMIRYLIKVKENPIYPESKSLRILNPFSLIAMEKDKEDILQFADFVAHAVYQCSNKSLSNYGIPETRYVSELGTRFAADKQGRVLGTGIKCIQGLSRLNLDPEVVRVFSGLRSQPPS